MIKDQRLDIDKGRERVDKWNITSLPTPLLTFPVVFVLHDWVVSL